MFNWYKYAQMSALNSLRLLDLDTNFTLEELEHAVGTKLNKWEILMGRVPQAEEMVKRIQDAYKELKSWVVDRSNKERMDFYL